MAFAMLAEDLVLIPHDNRLDFSAPRFHFLTGRPLEHLKNAEQVLFAFNLTLWSGTHTHEFQKSQSKFALSYDLIEEKFQVVKLGTPRKTTSRLTATAAEAWCLQEISADVSGLSPADPLWVRLEISAQDGKDRASLLKGGNISDAGISLVDGLIDLLSKPQESLPHWTLETGPITLNDLRRSHGRAE